MGRSSKEYTKAYNKAYRALHGEKERARLKQYRLDNKERKRAGYPAANAIRNARNLDPATNAETRLRGSKEQARKRGYMALDLTVEEVIEKLRVKECAICDRPIDGRRQHLDHDHRTGRFRGVLCPHCNIYLIGALESPLVEKAMDYLKRSKL